MQWSCEMGIVLTDGTWELRTYRVEAADQEGARVLAAFQAEQECVDRSLAHLQIFDYSIVKA